jgi:light-regulated signal transduction histidine kinase (bacteriophytochrome)
VAATEIAGAIENSELLAEVQGYALQMTERVADRTADLETANAELAAANAELESFAYTVSHDLRAPLRTIDGFSQALVEDCGEQVDETGREHIGRVRAAARRMGRLIDEILALSRVTRRELRVRPVDLSAMAREVAEELVRVEPGRGVSVQIADGLRAKGDPELLRLALQNLLDNAFKFTSKKDDATIEVGAHGTGAETVFFVRDNGAGFDMKGADMLFGPFRRLHLDSEFEGTGVGLATVHRIVQRHGGRIWAEAAVGQGATLYFTLATTPSAGKRSV